MKLPPYDNFPNITGNKISLRQIQLSDVNDLIEISFYDAVPATTLQEAIVMQDKINKDYIAGNSIHWGISDNRTNKIVGTCGYYRGLDKGEGELGCVLLPQFRGQGYMTCALLLAIDFGLSTIRLQRIWAITSQQNTEAIKLMDRVKFVKVANYYHSNEVEYELR